MMNPKIYTAPVPRMPPGLIELMEGLAKDVLKNNPADIFDYCSKHMEKLLKSRDGDGTKNGLTLSQKIARAQEKVRRRSEIRKKQYDEELESLNATKDNQIRCKREDNIELNPLYNQEVSAGIPAIDNLNNIGNVPFDGVANERTKTETNGKNLEVEYQVGSIENTPTFAELNPKTDLDEVQNDSEITVECYENSMDPTELIDTKNTNDLTEDKNHAGEITNTTIKDDDGKWTCGTDTTVVVNENNSTSNNEKEDVILKLSEMAQINNKTYTPTVDFRNEEANDLQSEDLSAFDYFDQNNGMQRTENTVPEGLLVVNTLNNDSGMFITNEEKDLDYEAQNNFSNDMDLEKAAITIQKVFRSFLFRSKTSSTDDATSVDVNLLIEDTNNEKHEIFENGTMIKDKRSLGLNRMDTVLQTVNEEKSLSLSTDDSSTLSSAATIIQAHVRGFLVRNKLNFNKTISSASNIESDIQSPKSLEKEVDNHKNKTVLNIHIIPEGENYLSRDESMMTSIDLPLDGSPSHSSNLHPLGYDKNERRKQLKREDAIQSISPPSNNSGKSDDIESVKEVLPHHDDLTGSQVTHLKRSSEGDMVNNNREQLISNNKVGAVNSIDSDIIQSSKQASNQSPKFDILTENSTDEMDVVTPFVAIENNSSMEEHKSRLLHSGEFHDIVLPTMVSRSNTSVVREFQNVFVYFLLWNNP